MPNNQPGEAEFRSILPEDIIWKPYPGFPTGVHNAAIVGDPTKPGPYTIIFGLTLVSLPARTGRHVSLGQERSDKMPHAM